MVNKNLERQALLHTCGHTIAVPGQGLDVGDLVKEPCFECQPCAYVAHKCGHKQPYFRLIYWDQLPRLAAEAATTLCDICVAVQRARDNY